MKLRWIMENEGHQGLTCAKTFNNVFHRHGLITRQASLAAAPCKQFARAAPNDLGQGDYKGHFTMKNGEYCFPLNVINDHSRFNLCTEALRSETFEEVRPAMERLFRDFDLPKAFLCDNGNPLGNAQTTGYTRFEVWLMELGLLTIHERAMRLQTQGKEERYNGSFNRECLNFNEIEDLERRPNSRNIVNFTTQSGCITR